MGDKSLPNRRAVFWFDCFYPYSNFHHSFCKLFLVNIKFPGFNPALDEVTSSPPIPTASLAPAFGILRYSTTRL